MKKHARTVILLLAVGAIAATTACDDSDVGVVRQSWTIEGRTEPQSCTAVNAAQMRLVAIDPFGVVRGTEFTSCTSFQGTLRLIPGVYSIAATFLSADGRAVSRTLTRDGVSVVDDEDTDYTVDFPLSVFLGQP